VLVLVVKGVLEKARPLVEAIAVVLAEEAGAGEARPLVEATAVVLAELTGAEEAVVGRTGIVITIVDVCTEVDVVTPPEQDPQGTVTVCVM